jgi:hypothetical protein
MVEKLSMLARVAVRPFFQRNGGPAFWRAKEKLH